MLTTVPPPIPVLPQNDPRTALVARLKDAILAVPFYFDSSTVIEGIEAGDLFSLNTVLGSTIEVQTVTALNKLQGIWDPDNKYSNFAFIRSSQSFPDVRLINTLSPYAEPLLGVELKGWYLLTKEKAPTFRYRVTPGACSDFDLLAVVPWHLNNVLSGKPVIREPFIISAKYAAQARNFYWTNMRGSALDRSITSPDCVTPYPKAGTEISDRPISDGGGNFGRIARVSGLMDSYISTTLRTLIAGIPAIYWIDFFVTFVDNHTIESIENEVRSKLARITSEWQISGEIDSIIETLVDSVANLFRVARNGDE